MMSQITQMELNTIRTIIFNEDLHAKKFQLYAQNCNDLQLQQFFNQQSLNASMNVRTLMSFLA